MNYSIIYKKISGYKAVLFISPFIIYIIASYLLWGPTHFSDIHRLFFNPSGDTELFTWTLNWWPYSIAHGLNPFMEKFLFNPSGYNLAWSTSIPTLAILMAPITAIWGATTSFNVLALIALPISALSCFYLIYFICKKYWVSVLCGFIYGFSTFQVAQLLGHPCFYVSFIPPLIILVVMLRLKDRLHKKLFILFLGILIAMQFGISSEAFASMTIFGVFTWLIVLIFADKKIRHKLYKTSLELLYSVIVALLFLSPFFYYIITGYSQEPHFFYPAVGYSSDLLNFIVPTKITLIGGNTFLNISNKFTANTAEQGTYLTLPLLLFMFGFCIYYWKKWQVKVMSIITLIIAVFSLGPRLQIESVRGWFPLPEAIFTRLPLARSMLPMRFSQYLFLASAIMIGYWFLYNAKKNSVNLAKYFLIILVLILMIPQVSNYSWQKFPEVTAMPKDPIPKFLSPKLVTKYIALHSNVLFLPYSVGYDPDIWQVYSGMKFTTVNGYLGWPPKSATDTKTAYDLYNEIPQANFKQNFIQFCKSRHLNEIISPPFAMKFGPVEEREIQSLNWPSYKVDNFAIIKVPKAYQ